MKHLLYHDLIVAGNWCNLKCSYCTSVADADDYGAVTSASRRGRGATIAIAEVLAMLDGFAAQVDAPLIKLSGGELFLLANAAELIAELAQRYAHVQVLTNGTELDAATVQRIARRGNVSFNLSLDGHSAAMNAMRWRSPRIGARVMAAFAAMVQACETVEITSVISAANAEGFPAFLDVLAAQPCRIVAVPIPVRGVTAAVLFPAEARRAFAATLRACVRTHPDVLGPAAYYTTLADFLDAGGAQRERRCHLVTAAVQLFDTGAVTPCPVGWTGAIGDLRKEGAASVAARVGTHKMYDLLTRERPRVPVCRNCFSAADMLNLYLDGEIELDALARLPLYHSAAARARLVELREAAVSRLTASIVSQLGSSEISSRSASAGGSASPMAMPARAAT
ncbi:Radical SAM [Rhodopseudomonas palustris HaA2]|uniref:Radical SAM n=1 Tax=Rhodopseudomonas palustris (strain HaA2) TaxID=316058 RepID=Q2IYD3_RHOP2|nr:radical SAM protein [Rhodopseudomonas palustris]ABD06777.1 Radical SAM [Rhodopseudomonas palustris HaA2]